MYHIFFMCIFYYEIYYTLLQRLLLFLHVLLIFSICFLNTRILIIYYPTTSLRDLATPFFIFILTPPREVTVYTRPPSRVNNYLLDCLLWGYYVNRDTIATGPVHILRFDLRLINYVQGVLFGKSVVSLLCYF